MERFIPGLDVAAPTLVGTRTSKAATFSFAEARSILAGDMKLQKDPGCEPVGIYSRIQAGINPKSLPLHQAWFRTHCNSMFQSIS
ncbi:MAG: hypothetical protein A4E62_01530 [Syntrophorhabdus sp. PtaU1.Bin002]|nr:MAG: hypothetical protein A4E62_01530 [Syntrophorhabdus sp. PtaU1.Bin002]